MPPIISIVGHSKSGKTTLIESLVRELKSRGYRVATIKHAPQEIAFDQPDKDSWRHIQAGSNATVIAGQDMLVLVKPIPSAATLDEIKQLFGEDYEIILAEGFKQDDAPKIEVHRKESGKLLTGLKRLVAIATDEPVETRARQFQLNDIKAIADLLEEGFIKPQSEGLALYVNDTPVMLSVFPREFITNVMLAMVSSLRGVGDIKRLTIFLKRKK